jgi:hypothetical protein
MIEQVHERVNVLAVFDQEIENIIIHKVRWNGRVYHISKMGYQYKRRIGRTMVHVFHVNNDSVHFKLHFDTEFLTWYLLEVSDGDVS